MATRTAGGVRHVREQRERVALQRSAGVGLDEELVRPLPRTPFDQFPRPLYERWLGCPDDLRHGRLRFDGMRINVTADVPTVTLFVTPRGETRASSARHRGRSTDHIPPTERGVMETAMLNGIELE